MMSMHPQEQVDEGKKVLYGAAIISFFVIIALVIGIGYPLIGQVYQAKDSLEEQKLILERIKSEMTETSKYQQLTDQIMQEKDTIDTAILKDSDIIPLIEHFERIAHELSLAIIIEQKATAKAQKAVPKPVTTTPTTDNEKQKVTEQKIASTPAAKPSAPPTATPPVDSGTAQSFMLTIDGEYKNFLTFLYKLENFPYGIKILNIDMNRKEQVLNPRKPDQSSVEGVSSKISIEFTVQ